MYELGDEQEKKGRGLTVVCLCVDGSVVLAPFMSYARREPQ